MSEWPRHGRAPGLGLQGVGGGEHQRSQPAMTGVGIEGLSVEPVVLDTTDPARVESVRADIEARFGRLDALVNDADVIVEGGFFQSNAVTVSQEDLEATFRVTELGTEAAPMEVPDGARAPVELALLRADGPSGRFIHLGQELPW